LPDEIWAGLLDLGMKMGGGLVGTLRLLDGKLMPDMIISNRGFVLGREAPGLAGAHGAIDCSVLTFAGDDIEGICLSWGRFKRRERWVVLNPQHPARRRPHVAYPPAAPNPAMTLPLQIRSQWRGLAEPERWEFGI
jgi:hypothetical protein